MDRLTISASTNLADLNCQIAGQRLCRGTSWLGHWLTFAGLLVCVVALVSVVGDPGTWAVQRAEILLTIGGLACWRWSWFVLQNLRAIAYRYFVFPRIRREALAAAADLGPVPEVTILLTTYREKQWITTAVFHSVFREVSNLEGLARRPRVVVATGCDEDDYAIRQIYSERFQASIERTDSSRVPELILLRGDTGKRSAIAMALKEIAAANLREDGVVILMDGDTVMGPGLLEKILPVFRITPPVGAVTTNEDGLVRGSGWFAEWISLRFGLRHRTMCSISLSGTLLCLTGRFSAFRASVATDPGFIAQIEHDCIKHWLWGQFEMLSGDDKSTWYWLAARGQRMLYVPDAMATTIEVVEGSAVSRAWANILRWSGNSLRHSGRAFLLGPAKLGVYPWWTLLDQRVSMWTILFGPLIGLLAVCAGRHEIAASYLLWVLCSRVGHSAMSWRHGRRFSLAYIPLEILSEWSMAVAKIWILFHPARQNWINRGARTLDSTRRSTLYPLRRGLALYLLCLTCVGIVLAIGMKTGLLPSPEEMRLFLNKASSPARVDSAADASAIGKLPEAPHFGDSASAVRDLRVSGGTEADSAIQMAPLSQ